MRHSADGYAETQNTTLAAAQKKVDDLNKQIAVLNDKNKVLQTVVSAKKAKAGKKKATVSWKSAGAGFTYEVFRATKPDGKFKKVATTGKTKATVKKLKKGKTYYFKVRAFKTVGGQKVYTGFSNIKKAKIKK